jgi:hypothetical protein
VGGVELAFLGLACFAGGGAVGAVVVGHKVALHLIGKSDDASSELRKAATDLAATHNGLVAKQQELEDKLNACVMDLGRRK